MTRSFFFSALALPGLADALPHRTGGCLAISPPPPSRPNSSPLFTAQPVDRTGEEKPQMCFSMHAHARVQCDSPRAPRLSARPNHMILLPAPRPPRGVHMSVRRRRRRPLPLPAGPATRADRPSRMPPSPPPKMPRMLSRPARVSDASAVGGRTNARARAASYWPWAHHTRAGRVMQAPAGVAWRGPPNNRQRCVSVFVSLRAKTGRAS